VLVGDGDIGRGITVVDVGGTGVIGSVVGNVVYGFGSGGKYDMLVRGFFVVVVGYMGNDMLWGVPLGISRFPGSQRTSFKLYT